mgnify:CR=1 FL=1
MIDEFLGKKAYPKSVRTKAACTDLTSLEVGGSDMCGINLTELGLEMVEIKYFELAELK